MNVTATMIQIAFIIVSEGCFSLLEASSHGPLTPQQVRGCGGRSYAQPLLRCSEREGGADAERGGRDTSRRVLPNTIIPPSPISFPRRVGLGEQGVVVCLPRPLPLPGHVPPASQWGSGGVGEEALGLGGEGKNLVLQLQRLPDLRSSHHPTPYRGVNTP